MINVPDGWTNKDFELHNDQLAKKYGEPKGDDFTKSLEEARRHLRAADRRRDLEGRYSEMHAAVEALLRAVAAREVQP
jgi:hypothetical protein